MLTESQVVAQSVLFLIAGFETSSTLLTFMCYELAINLDIQEKLRQEIHVVLKRHNGKCTHEAMQEMLLLDMVLMGMYCNKCGCIIFVIEKTWMFVIKSNKYNYYWIYLLMF